MKGMFSQAYGDTGICKSSAATMTPIQDIGSADQSITPWVITPRSMSPSPLTLATPRAHERLNEIKVQKLTEGI